jgi:hypothetical protein
MFLDKNPGFKVHVNFHRIRFEYSMSLNACRYLIPEESAFGQDVAHTKTNVSKA